MRLAIVEDDDMTRGQLLQFLRNEPRVESVEVFACAEELLEQLESCSAELMLVDLELPDMHGIELIRKVKRLRPGIEIMVYTVFGDRASVVNAIKAGASGYILKDCPMQELMSSLRALYLGGAPMSPQVARKVVLELQSVAATGVNPLTYRESVIVQCLEQGLTYKQIACRFRISPHTVHTHIKNIYEKLQAHGRHDALRRARTIGIV